MIIDTKKMKNIFNTAIINAGGNSTRIGTDKAFARVNDKRLIDIVINNIRGCFEDIILVTNKPHKYYGYNNIKIVSDAIRGIGPMAGLYTGLMESQSKYCFLIACDMPLINYDYIRYMKQKIIKNGYDAVITQRQKGIEPFHGFYSTRLKAGIAENISKGIYSFYDMLKERKVLYVKEEVAARFDRSLNFFTNINTKEDFAKAREIF